MTPPAAVTPAGRAATKRRTSGRTATGAPREVAGQRSQRAATPGHRRKLAPKPAPQRPRRVSGPISGRLAAALAPGRTEAPTRQSRTAEPVPRPRTKPARPAEAAPRPGTRRSRGAEAVPRLRIRDTSTPLRSRALAFVRALPDHPLLDRLIRGRAWIPLLGVLLAGIVAMQVEVLKLNSSIGRSIERGTALQNRNEELRMAVAGLDGDQRIERLATASGMIMPAPDAIGFLSTSPRSPSGATVGRAIANIHQPDAGQFLSLISSNGGIATTSSAQPTDPTSIAAQSTTDNSAQTAQASSSTSSADTSQTGTTAASTQASSQATTTQQSSTSQQAGQSQQATSGTAATSTGSTAQSQSSGSSSGGTGIPVG